MSYEMFGAENSAKDLRLLGFTPPAPHLSSFPLQVKLECNFLTLACTCGKTVLCLSPPDSDSGRALGVSGRTVELTTLLHFVQAGERSDTVYSPVVAGFLYAREREEKERQTVRKGRRRVGARMAEGVCVRERERERESECGSL